MKDQHEKKVAVARAASGDAVKQFLFWGFLSVLVVAALAFGLLLAVRKDGVRDAWALADWQNIGAFVGLLSVPVALAGSFVAIRLAAGALEIAQRQTEIGQLAARTAENQEHIQAAAIYTPAMEGLEQLQFRWAEAVNEAWDQLHQHLLDQAKLYQVLTFGEMKPSLRLDAVQNELAREDDPADTDQKSQTQLCATAVIESCRLFAEKFEKLRKLVVEAARHPLHRGVLHRSYEGHLGNLASPVCVTLKLQSDRAYSKDASAWNDPSRLAELLTPLKPLAPDGILLLLSQSSKFGEKPYFMERLRHESMSFLPYPFLWLRRTCPGPDAEAYLLLIAHLFSEEKDYAFLQTGRFLALAELLLNPGATQAAAKAYFEGLGIWNDRVERSLQARITTMDACSLLNKDVRRVIADLQQQATLHPETFGVSLDGKETPAQKIRRFLSENAAEKSAISGFL